MSQEELSKESVLFKTLTSVEKMPDGSCIKRITETKGGKTIVKEEQVDCENAVQGLKEKDESEEDFFRKGNDDFDEKMRDKLKELNKNFADGGVKTKEETISDGVNKVVKVTRESSSIEETRKNEKVPDGTRRTLKIVRDSLVEETSKSVKPYEPEEEPDGVKLLNESFSEENVNKKVHTNVENEEKLKDVVPLDDSRELSNKVSSEEEQHNNKNEEKEDEGIFSKIIKFFLSPFMK